MGDVLNPNHFDESCEKIFLDGLKSDHFSESDSVPNNLSAEAKRQCETSTPLNDTQTPDQLSGYNDTAVFTIPQPKLHPPSLPPYCEACVKREVSIFNTNCPGCLCMLEKASIPQIFGILRQWNSKIQHNAFTYIQLLIDGGCSTEDYDLVSGHSVLHFAVRCGSKNVGSQEVAVESTKYLLSIGASLYTRALWTGMMPIHYAAFFNVHQVIPILVQHPTYAGFDIDYTCDEYDGGTSLHLAAVNLSSDAAKSLLELGASLNVNNDKEQRPADVIPEIESQAPDSEFSLSVRSLRKLFASYEEKEMISVPNYDDVHGKALLLAMGIKIGDQVIISDDKQGRLMFCGKTEFAMGIWAGVELAENEGRNDGSVSGISYFKCPNGRGIFAPITKISKPGLKRTTKRRSSIDVERGKLDVSRVTSRINTGVSRANSVCSSIGDTALEVGDRVVVAGYKKGSVRFYGETQFAPGMWFGVELDRPVGKNDGAVSGQRYFTCKPKYGVFCTSGKLKRAPLTRAGSNDSLNSLNSLNKDTSWTLSVKKLSGYQSGANSVGSLNSSFNAGMSGSSTPRGVSRSRTDSVSGRHGRKPTAVKHQTDYKLKEGMTVLFSNEMAVIRYIGGVGFAEGCWLGLELKTSTGKNNGEVKGRRYFTCKPNHGVMVKPSRVSVKGINGAKLIGDSYQNTKQDTSEGAADKTGE